MPPPEMVPLQRREAGVYPSMGYPRPLTTPQLAEISPIPYPYHPFSTLPQRSQHISAQMTSPRLKTYVATGRGPAGDFLDDAVDELFLSDSHNETILDFVSAWDPTAYGADSVLTNDVQLGNLLDRLLEE
jgi:hypothetical protein